MPAPADGGGMQGGAPRAVWFTGEHDPRSVSARSVAADLGKQDRPPHLVWHPGSGELVQLLPATRAARLLPAPVCREGRTCLQIMVVGQARVPFTGSLLTGIDVLMRWLDAWHVARRWPAGPPLPSPQSYHSARSRRDWARGGHFGASQAPLTERPDPGGIDIRRITGPDTPVAPLPRPRAPLPEPSLLPRTALPGPARPPAGDPVPVGGRSEPVGASS